MSRAGAFDVGDLIERAQAALTPTDRRLAHEVLRAPQEVAFGSVAELAAQAGVSGASVVRFATKLGLDGFVDLQQRVRQELADRLEPASQRIRREEGDGLLARARAREVDAVSSSLAMVDDPLLTRSVALLADPAARVTVVSGDATAGIARQLATDLSVLRPGVELGDGPPTRVERQLVGSGAGDVVVAIDVHRYEAWLVEVVERAVARGVALVALTDSRLSPLAADATATFVITAAGIGPFETHVGTLAVANLLVAGVAEADRGAAAGHIDAVEAAWTDADLLLDR